MFKAKPQSKSIQHPSMSARQESPNSDDHAQSVRLLKSGHGGMQSTVKSVD